MVTFINNSTPGTDYYLYFGDGGSSTGTEFHQTVNYQYLTPGVYVPYIKASSACGSDSVLMDTIRVNGAPKVEFSNLRSKMCLGSEIYIKYTPSNLLHPKWFVNYQLVDSLVNPFVFHPLSIGTYKIGVVVSNQFCTGLDSFEVRVESAPDIQIGMNEVTCDTMRVVITGNYHIGKLEVDWGDGVTDFGKLYHVYQDTGLYFVKIMLVEGLCTLYFEREIEVKLPPRFRVSAHPKLTECLNPGDTISMAIQLDSMAYQVDMFNWTGAPVCLNCERTIRNIHYSICEPKTFKIVVRDKDQCRSEQKMDYACFDPGGNKYKAFVPNAFTPKNGDLMNDIFIPRIPYYESGMNYDLKIYNRWGELLFHTNDPFEGWDGTYKGNICEMDVYVYLIEYGCPEYHFNKHRGTFHLLR
jgi:gliding motility-associated-like protein